MPEVRRKARTVTPPRPKTPLEVETAVLMEKYGVCERDARRFLKETVFGKEAINAFKQLVEGGVEKAIAVGLTADDVYAVLTDIADNINDEIGSFY